MGPVAWFDKKSLWGSDRLRDGDKSLRSGPDLIALETGCLRGRIGPHLSCLLPLVTCDLPVPALTQDIDRLKV